MYKTWIRIYFFINTFLLTIIWHLPSHAQVSPNFKSKVQPKYEWGLGLLGASIPDYPGSANNTFRVIPLPWIIYRGEYLRLDEEGSRARVKSTQRYEVGLSGGFNFPVDSADIPVRNGMPDLDALISAGPNFIWRFFSRSGIRQLNFRLALRTAYSTDITSRFRHEGYLMEPSLNYWRRFGPKKRTAFILGLSLVFADKDYNSYFFEVEPAFATAERPTFETEAGLNEVEYTLALSHQFTAKIQGFVGASLSDLGSSKNRNSPLIQEQQNLSYAAGFIWSFGESEEKVGLPKSASPPGKPLSETPKP